jgi:hypothetical protein
MLPSGHRQATLTNAQGFEGSVCEQVDKGNDPKWTTEFANLDQGQKW